MAGDQWVQVFALAASLVSVMLAFFAIWLAWKFYQASSVSTEQTKEAAKAIHSGVAQLDRLFGSLYADTFSMMRETYSDIRRRAFEPPLPEATDASGAVRAQIDEGLRALRAELNKDVAAIAERIGAPEGKAAAVKEQVEQVVDKAITATHSIEETIRSDALGGVARGAVLMALGGADPRRPAPGRRTIAEVLNSPAISDHIGIVQAERAIRALEMDGLVSIRGDYSPAAEVELTERGRAMHLAELARWEQDKLERRERVRREDARLRAEGR
jgi:hypothetical protein